MPSSAPSTRSKSTATVSIAAFIPDAAIAFAKRTLWKVEASHGTPKRAALRRNAYRRSLRSCSSEAWNARAASLSWEISRTPSPAQAAK